MFTPKLTAVSDHLSQTEDPCDTVANLIRSTGASCVILYSCKAYAHTVGCKSISIR
jgi:hypothetical protein